MFKYVQAKHKKVEKKCLLGELKNNLFNFRPIPTTVCRKTINNSELKINLNLL